MDQHWLWKCPQSLCVLFVFYCALGTIAVRNAPLCPFKSLEAFPTNTSKQQPEFTINELSGFISEPGEQNSFELKKYFLLILVTLWRCIMSLSWTFCSCKWWRETVKPAAADPHKHVSLRRYYAKYHKTRTKYYKKEFKNSSKAGCTFSFNRVSGMTWWHSEENLDLAVLLAAVIGWACKHAGISHFNMVKSWFWHSSALKMFVTLKMSPTRGLKKCFCWQYCPQNT